MGWRILRFNEEAIDEQIDAVKESVFKHLSEASEHHKAAEEDGKMIKTASKEEGENPQKNEADTT